MTSDWLAHLHPQQRAAATHQEGHALVLAGAGSGKTTTLTYRIAWLLEQGVDPRQLCAVTFTNRAAAELKQRLTALAGEEGGRVWAMTFHSACVRILRIDGHLLGLPPRWTVADRDDSIRVLSRIFKEKRIEDKPANILRKISRCKNAGIKAQNCQDEEIRPVWLEYQARLWANGQLDFDDLLLFGYDLLQADPERKWQKRFAHVLVDEYQDTNPIQEKWLQSLVGDGKIWVVGDELQVLYRFRLAEVSRILSFSERWEGTRTYPIESNYRSQALIVEAANAVVKASSERTDKVLRSTKPAGRPVGLIQYPSALNEASHLTRQLSKAIEEFGEAECAILYRQHDQSRLLEKEFRAAKIPYRIIGGVGFYARLEVKLARSLLQLVFNPSDQIAAERVLLAQTGFGQSSFEKLLEWARARECPILEVAYGAPQLPKMPKKAALAAQKVAQAVGEVRKGDQSLLAAYRFLRDRLELIAWARDDKERAQERVRNLGEFENALDDQDSWHSSLPQFLEETSLHEEHNDPDRPTVLLMTVHSAKGLEWDWVWLCGCEEELYIREPSDQEDSRRLVHVALTRGRAEANISYCSERMRWGQVQPAHPLWLLQELPASVQRRKYKSQGSNKGTPSPRQPLSSQQREKAAQWLKQPVEKYPPGCGVWHAKFGRGVVVKDGSERVDIHFSSGPKTLLKSHARLKRIV
jgi:DNA helicase-2/ATP-dependent DNA helicase PcrA